MKLPTILGVGVLSITLAACGGSGSGIKIDPKYGVAASPRMTNAPSIPSGGGRYQVGKPYKIAGKWYKPREVKQYEKTGMASWYGDAFHGRKTANGELYNMNAFSAAHPTLPLPSYVRVTNVANKHSVIVRVNDRGPFAHNRLIDLSKRTAQVLDFKNAGVAKVHVKYIGRAPVDGGDAQFLASSVRQNGRPMHGSGRRAHNESVPGAMQHQTASSQNSTPINARVAFRESQKTNGAPLLIWGDEVPPVGSGYVSMYVGN
ncbi:MAG: septal ring lytic transglycosylase RlpA family protein [Hyphomicrobiales bacterium]